MIAIWPDTGDAEKLGEKAQGLIDLARLELPVPPALILRGDLLEQADLNPRQIIELVIARILRFQTSPEGPARPISLRCAAKGRSEGGRILPELVLNLGIKEAIVMSPSSEAVCEGHASAFFAFFGEQLRAGFPLLPLRDQLDALLSPLVPHLRQLGSESPRTLVVQRMVYGDWDSRSLTGTCYTRHPRSGEAIDYGHIIFGRQGMALGGVHDASQRDLSEMADINPAAYSQLKRAFLRIEEYYREVRQLEFTAEGEALYILQNTRGNSTFRLATGT